MTQKQLIASIQQLKEIKPRKEWAVLLKSTLLENKVPSRMTGVVSAPKVRFTDVLRSVFFQRKLVYAFSVILLFVVGIFGFAGSTVPGDILFPIKKIAEQSQAALTGQPDSVANLNNSIKDLAKLAKEGRTNNIPSAISEVSANASQLAKNLKDNPTKDPQMLKEIAVSLKTLADVPGTDLTGNQDVKDLYRAVVQNQIADLEKTTLTDEQSNTLAEVKDLYDQEKYAGALEKILSINN